MTQEKLSKHERKKLKLKQRKQEKVKEQQRKNTTGKIKKYSSIALVLIFIGSIFSVFVFSGNSETGNSNLNTGNLTFPLGNIHWHATPLIEICGEKKSTPVPLTNRHLGSNLLHTHEDSLIHIEGNVQSPEHITLGKFFDGIAVKFSETKIMNKTNGDLCNGNKGKVKMLVNGKENFEFRNYVIKEKDVIKIIFE